MRVRSPETPAEQREPAVMPGGDSPGDRRECAQRTDPESADHGCVARLSPAPAHLRQLTRETTVRTTIDETFAFFSDAGNLDRLTPEWLHFRVLTPLPVILRAGSVLDYRIRLFGVPFYWRTRIVEWRPPQCFVDFQERGPYLWWHHTHTFAACGSGTRVTDVVEYAAPLALVSEPLLVNRWVRRIFDFRQAQLRAVLGGA